MHYAPQVCLDGSPKSACPGDSGGPSVVMDPRSGWPYNIGMVSYGAGECCTLAGGCLAKWSSHLLTALFVYMYSNFHTLPVAGVDPYVINRATAFWNWIRTITGLSLKYHDVVLNTAGGFIRATDASPTTGYIDPGYITPSNAGSDKPPKMQVNKTVDSWSVSAPLPDGATIVSQAYLYGLNIALYGVNPTTYDHVFDLVNYKPSQCKAAKDGRSIKCFDATCSVTVALRGGSSEAKLTVKASGRDILLRTSTTGLKAFLWLTNGDNWLVYNEKACQLSGDRKIGLKC